MTEARCRLNPISAAWIVAPFFVVSFTGCYHLAGEREELVTVYEEPRVLQNGTQLELAVGPQNESGDIPVDLSEAAECEDAVFGRGETIKSTAWVKNDVSAMCHVGAPIVASVLGSGGFIGLGLAGARPFAGAPPSAGVQTSVTFLAAGMASALFMCTPAMLPQETRSDVTRTFNSLAGWSEHGHVCGTGHGASGNGTAAAGAEPPAQKAPVAGATVQFALTAGSGSELKQIEFDEKTDSTGHAILHARGIQLACAYCDCSPVRVSVGTSPATGLVLSTLDGSPDVPARPRRPPAESSAPLNKAERRPIQEIRATYPAVADLALKCCLAPAMAKAHDRCVETCAKAGGVQSCLFAHRACLLRAARGEDSERESRLCDQIRQECYVANGTSADNIDLCTRACSEREALPACQ